MTVTPWAVMCERYLKAVKSYYEAMFCMLIGQETALATMERYSDIMTQTRLPPSITEGLLLQSLVPSVMQGCISYVIGSYCRDSFLRVVGYQGLHWPASGIIFSISSWRRLLRIFWSWRLWQLTVSQRNVYQLLKALWPKHSESYRITSEITVKGSPMVRIPYSLKTDQDSVQLD